MNKIAKGKGIEFRILEKVSDYKTEQHLTKQKLAEFFGTSTYLLNKLIAEPNNSRLSVYKKVMARLGLKFVCN